MVYVNSLFPTIRVGAHKMNCCPYDYGGPEERFEELGNSLLREYTFSLDNISAVSQCAPSEALALQPTCEQLLDIAGMEGHVDQAYKTGGS